jgi:hypothetical protein
MADSELYDLEVCSLAYALPRMADDDRRVIEQSLQQYPPPARQSWRSGKMIYLARSLAEAREFVAALEERDGDARVISVRYREPIIYEQEGRRLAYEELKRTHPNIDVNQFDWSIGYDRRSFWRFYALAPAKEGELDRPLGADIIDIDKLDGHVHGSAAEMGSREDPQDRYDVLLMGEPFGTPHLPEGDLRLLAESIERFDPANVVDPLDEDVVLYVALRLDEARRLAGAIKRAGVTPFLIPTRYREVRVTREEARQMAQLHLDRTNAEGSTVYGDLRGPRENSISWSFAATEIGKRWSDLDIAVDKFDGHIITDEEYWAWVNLFDE